jgi:hypothetical protein
MLYKIFLQMWPLMISEISLVYFTFSDVKEQYSND